MAKPRKRIATEWCAVSFSPLRPYRVSGKMCFWRKQDAQRYIKRVRKRTGEYMALESRRTFRTLPPKRSR